jgi:hypothetical protein
VAVLVAPHGAAQEISDTQIFPVVARTAGAGGTQWVSDVTIHNLEDHALVVGIQLFPADQANTFNILFPDRFTLAARETRIIEDVLSSVFGYTSNIKGVLVMTVSEDFIPANPEDSDIVAVSRTYNVGSPEGTYGQTVLSPAEVVLAGNSEPVVATGARNDGLFRSNLGIVSLSILSGITVHYRILDEDGVVLAQGLRQIPQATMKQWSFEQLGVGQVEGALTAEVWLDPASVSPDPCNADFPVELVGYVSKVDNGTGDAEFIMASSTSPLECD